MSRARSQPHKKSEPVYAFSKAERDFEYAASVSPGAVYKSRASVGPQCSSALSSSPMFGFGSSSRFPLTPGENRAHLEMLRAIKKSGRQEVKHLSI